ncbi:MAG: hypothetical protein H0U77_03890, partial [Nocardioidaceae bacterium]|nr:hypothetical protein [Nocardioidaceae bacterium]
GATAAEPDAVDAGDPETLTATPDVGALAGTTPAEASAAADDPAGGRATRDLDPNDTPSGEDADPTGRSPRDT